MRRRSAYWWPWQLQLSNRCGVRSPSRGRPCEQPLLQEHGQVCLRAPPLNANSREGRAAVPTRRSVHLSDSPQRRHAAQWQICLLRGMLCCRPSDAAVILRRKNAARPTKWPSRSQGSVLH